MTDTPKADLGVLGLAVMGANLARNAASRGFGVALFNRHGERTDALIREHGGEGRFVATKSLPEFIAALKAPRIAIVMVKAGKPVDDIIDELMPHLEPDDILIDAGNSLFSDTVRREKSCKEEKGVRFVGMGVSGGEEGALNGPSMMPGGDPAAYDRIAPFITKMAAQAFGRPCCAHIGPDGAGHYVKMVHNGIEYADMQLIAETYDVLKSVYGLSAGEHRRRVRGLEIERARFLSHRHHRQGAAQDRRHGGGARRSDRRRGRAEGHRALDGPVRA